MIPTTDTFNAFIEAIEHADIFGKKLKYLMIHTQNGSHAINIGQKTYETIQKLAPTLQTINTPNPKQNEQKTTQMGNKTTK